MPKKQLLKRKHVPLRTCIACRETSAKRELVRVVRTVDGHVLVDETSKKPGRGAYICRSRSCWDMVMRKGLLEYALKSSLTDEDSARLISYYESLPDSPDEEPAAQ